MRNSALKFFLLGFTIVTAMSSCVPLAVGAAGVAAGYIARDEGVGVAEPAGSSGSEPTYDSSEAPVY
jgi:mannose/fructose/N-acetylgalactosamine-specific phosphotransferase system component IIC